MTWMVFHCLKYICPGIFVDDQLEGVPGTIKHGFNISTFNFNFLQSSFFIIIIFFYFKGLTFIYLGVADPHQVHSNH